MAFEIQREARFEEAGLRILATHPWRLFRDFQPTRAAGDVGVAEGVARPDLREERASTGKTLAAVSGGVLPADTQTRAGCTLTPRPSRVGPKWSTFGPGSMVPVRSLDAQVHQDRQARLAAARGAPDVLNHLSPRLRPVVRAVDARDVHSVGEEVAPTGNLLPPRWAS